MAYPSTGNPITELLINGTWTDVSSYVRGDTGVQVTRGRANEQGRVSAQTCGLTLNNRDGRFSNRNPTSPYFGLLPRNTQLRVTAGSGDNYLKLLYNDDNTLNNVSTVDKAVLDIVGDLDVRAEVWPHTWRTGRDMIIMSKYQVTGEQRSWVLFQDKTGKLCLIWTTAGTLASAIAARSTVAIPATSGRLAVRATLDVDNGAAGNTVTFYTSTAIGGSWTILGTAVTAAGVTSIFSSSADLVVGGGDDNQGIFSNGVGVGNRIYKAEVYSGIAGTLRANMDATAQTVGATSWSDALATPNTWTLTAGARITTDRIRFWGETSALPQVWDKPGKDVQTPITASGMIRRLTQGASPLTSPIYRNFIQYTPHGYWTFEDGSESTKAASSVTGGQAATTTAVTFGAATTLPGSAQTVQFTGSTSKITGNAKTVSNTGTASFVFYVRTTSLPAAQKTLLTLYTTGTARRIDVGLSAANWYTEFFDSTGTSLASSIVAITTISPAGQWIGYNLLLETSGANMNYSIRWDTVGVTSGGVGPTAIATASPGRFASFKLAASTDTAFQDAQFGHLVMSTTGFDLSNTTFRDASKAYLDETAATRIDRLASEEGVAVEITGIWADTETMGYQTTSTFMDLVYECADADQGILGECRDRLALTYLTRNALETRANVTLSESSKHLSEVPLPTEDDQGVTNDATVRKQDGSSARSTVDTGSMSTLAPPNGIGRYDTDVTLAVGDDDRLPDIAAWKTHLGTWDEARFPNLSVGLHRSVITADITLTGQIIAADLGDTATLSGLPAWMPPDSVLLLVQGYTESLRKYLWDLTFNTTPAGPYNTGRYGVNVGTTTGVSRYDHTSSTLASSATSVATSLSVAANSTTPSTVDLWTTVVGSFPFDIIVGGERMTVTAISGASSPQTFTVTRSVNAVVKAQTAGTRVKLFNTVYYRL